MDRHQALYEPIISVDWRKPVAAAYVVILLTFGGAAGWATLSKLDSAAIAHGVVMAQSNKKTIQHLEGGIVREIFVRNGDMVKEGDVLLRLDDTQAKASLETLSNQLVVARIQEARLLAERDQSAVVNLPPDINSRLDENVVARIYDDQLSNMRERHTYLNSQIAVQEAKIAQTNQEIKALEADAEISKQQLGTLDQELGGLRQLLSKQLVSISRVASLERERFRLQGVVDRAISDGKKGVQLIHETRLMIVQLQKQFRQQVSNDIIEVRKNISDLREKESVAQDVLSRLHIKAPRTGIVQALKVYTIGAVIRPGDAVMEISPTGDELTINVKISPSDADSLIEGLRTEVRFPTYHSRRVPFMFGHLKSVSYDRLNDEKNNEPFYEGEIIVSASSVPPELKDKLKPGLPVDAYINTGEQTPLDYFLGPLFDRVGKGIREK